MRERKRPKVVAKIGELVRLLSLTVFPLITSLSTMINGFNFLKASEYEKEKVLEFQILYLESIRAYFSSIGNFTNLIVHESIVADIIISLFDQEKYMFKIESSFKHGEVDKTLGIQHPAKKFHIIVKQVALKSSLIVSLLKFSGHLSLAGSISAETVAVTVQWLTAISLLITGNLLSSNSC